MTSSNLQKYARGLAALAGNELLRATVFAKVLTVNDDSGRHGILVPSEAYKHFPEMVISEPTENVTLEFEAFDCVERTLKNIAFKYYQRYPERRVTRLGGFFNQKLRPLLIVILKAVHMDGSVHYYVDGSCESESRFSELTAWLYGDHKDHLTPGIHVLREIESRAFSMDAPLRDLLALFDGVRGMGWVDTLRPGNTGVGYTFETLIGISENNDKHADFQGIEIKCKRKRDRAASTGKINLFQQVPEWTHDISAKQRIRQLGSPGADGLYQCYSQVSTTANNLALELGLENSSAQIDLLKAKVHEGRWTLEKLEARLLEKHSRTIFVKANTGQQGGIERFQYEELTYCEMPSVGRFLDLVRRNGIVFEFTMSEKENGQIRNHGYPWRLNSEEMLPELFASQTRLR